MRGPGSNGISEPSFHLNFITFERCDEKCIFVDCQSDIGSQVAKLDVLLVIQLVHMRHCSFIRQAAAALLWDHDNFLAHQTCWNLAFDNLRIHVWVSPIQFYMNAGCLLPHVNAACIFQFHRTFTSFKLKHCFEFGSSSQYRCWFNLSNEFIKLNCSHYLQAKLLSQVDKDQQDERLRAWTSANLQPWRLTQSFAIPHGGRDARGWSARLSNCNSSTNASAWNRIFVSIRAECLLGWLSKRFCCHEHASTICCLFHWHGSHSFSYLHCTMSSRTLPTKCKE